MPLLLSILAAIAPALLFTPLLLLIFFMKYFAFFWLFFIDIDYCRHFHFRAISSCPCRGFLFHYFSPGWGFFFRFHADDLFRYAAVLPLMPKRWFHFGLLMLEGRWRWFSDYRLLIADVDYFRFFDWFRRCWFRFHALRCWFLLISLSFFAASFDYFSLFQLISSPAFDACFSILPFFFSSIIFRSWYYHFLRYETFHYFSPLLLISFISLSLFHYFSFFFFIFAFFLSM